MNLIDNLCMNCFEQLTEGSVCPHCGFDNDTVSDMLFLPRKTVLNQRYVVGNVISQESDAITYIGLDTQSKRLVTIRELLPKNIGNRLEGNPDVHIRERYKKSFVGYKASFIKLWKTLRSMNKLSAVIPVVEVFEENQTAYAVCEKLEYVTLRDFLIKNDENIIDWEQARLMFMPVLTTLENLHSNGIIHGGINPDNLVLCRDGKVRLLGFCISECNSAQSELEFNENSGYTALEQYDNAHKICPATDIYAFSACIYRALVGTNPPNAVERETNDKLMIPNRIAETIPAHVIKALGAGLQIYPEKRIQQVYDFRELLNAAPSVVAKAEAAKPEKADYVETEEEHIRSQEKQAQKVEKGGKGKVVAIVIILVALIAAAVYVIGFTDLISGNKETTTAPVSVAQVEVPDFCTAGYTESDVQNSGSWNKQFKITFTYEYSKEVEEGIVFKQSVEKGQSVAEGTEIILTVSKGIEMGTVPDVGGLTKDEAVEKLTAEGFSVQIVSVYNLGEYTPNTVRKMYGMAPAAGTELAKGEQVIIEVYGEVETTTEAATEAAAE